MDEGDPASDHLSEHDHDIGGVEISGVEDVEKLRVEMSSELFFFF